MEDLRPLKTLHHQNPFSWYCDVACHQKYLNCPNYVDICISLIPIPTKCLLVKHKHHRLMKYGIFYFYKIR